MIQALGQNIIVQKDEQKETMEKGIIIPRNAERTPRFAPTILGTVISVGKKVVNLKPGDRVALKVYCGDEMFTENKCLTICREKDIVGLAYEQS